MTDRPVYVYRLKVDYPVGVDWRNPPEGWEPTVVPGVEGDHETTFAWPARKHYVSQKGAEGRADLLRGWGCTVVIERSKRVSWEGDWV